MFIADGLVYLELQKTGGTHIRRLLEKYTSGHPVGKHNRLRTENGGSFVFGSIRNPWEWYVSLWAYGVAGKGAVRARCARGLDFHYYRRLLPKAMGKNWLTPTQLVISMYHDALKPVREWQAAYDNPEDPELFRAWLGLLLDRRRRFDVGEGYGFSPLSRHAGLLTYRYFRLFTQGDPVYRDKRLRSSAGIGEFDREFNICREMIRTESLEEDFIRIMGDAGYSLSDGEVAEIRNRTGGKTNVSERQPASYYYDPETVDMVAVRDEYLIEKYGYQPPL